MMASERAAASGRKNALASCQLSTGVTSVVLRRADAAGTVGCLQDEVGTDICEHLIAAMDEREIGVPRVLTQVRLRR